MAVTLVWLLEMDGILVLFLPKFIKDQAISELENSEPSGKFSYRLN